jgi:hypothetical protein
MCQKEKTVAMFRKVIIPRIKAERKADRLACGRPVDGELDLRYDRFGLVLDGELGTLLAAFSMIHEFVDIGVVLAKICSSSSGAATAGQHADKMQTFLLAHAGIRAATTRRSRLTAVNKLLENDNQVISMCLGEDETWKTSHFARSVRSQLRTAGVRPPSTFSSKTTSATARPEWLRRAARWLSILTASAARSMMSASLSTGSPVSG